MRALGKLFSNTGSGSIPFVAVRDIATSAVAVALRPELGGKTYEITGPESLTHSRVAEKFGRTLGIPVEFVNVPESAASQAMAGSGVPGWLASDLAALNSQFAGGVHGEVSPDVERLTGRPAFRFDNFLEKYVG